MEEPTEDPGGQEASRGASGHQRECSPMLHLDLYNFECPEAEGSRYVLTSPRSLEACARCLVKPVELLARSLSDLVKEAPGRSMRVATGLCEVYEIDRQRKLKMCREERERIIRQEKRRILPMVISSSLGSPSTSKCPSRADTISAMESKRYNSPPTTSHQRKITPPSEDAHRTETPPSKSNSPLTKGSKKHHPPSSKDHKSDPSLLKNVPSCDSPATMEPLHAVPPKNKSQSLDSLQRMRDGTSARTSSESATSSFSGDSARDKAAQFLQRPQTLETVNSLMGRSFSLGDLSHSPQTTKKVEKMVKEVKKMGVRELPQRDKKIAALMIARHQEENIRNEHRYWAHLQWDTQRKTSELKREQEERERHRILVQGQKRWEYQIKKKSNITSLEEPSASSLTQSSSAQLEKWKEQDQEKETIKRGKLEKSKEGGEQKKTQRKKEALEQVEEANQQKQLTDQNKKLEKKKAEKMKHQVLLQELSQKEESENEELKKTLENNLHRAQENIDHLLEKRNQDLKNKARKEELQILRARQAAERKERERREHLDEQVRTAQRRLQHASQVAEEVAHHKARKALEGRLEKEKVQRENRERVQKKEDMKRQELLVSIEKKLERSEQIYKEKQTVLDNARSVARASFNIREKVRAETNIRTFDKMAQEAEMYASIDKN
uniref:Coiled-coil domain-containing protein 177 n=1 Tax=Leptobrachium leishanense TaxID=445787 RepID=A0A8C5QXD7_9ANUR